MVRHTRARRIARFSPASYQIANRYVTGNAPSGREVPGGRYSPGVLVSDLNHFLDLPDDVPGPTRRLAGQLGDLVRAASAGDAGMPWQTALECRRRP